MSSLMALKKLGEHEPKPIPPPKSDVKDETPTSPNAPVFFDAELRAALLSLPGRMSTLEQRMTKAESLSALVNSAAMSQPLPSGTPTGESKTSLFGQLKDAIAELGPVW